VGAGTNGTEATIDEVSGLAVGRSVVAALVVVPYYTRPSEPAIVDHFAAVADAAPVPVLVYNVPHRTGSRLGSAALLDLAGHANVAGVKQAVGALDADTLHLLASAGRDFHVLAGDDALIAPMMLLGGAGAVAAAAHLCTPAFVALVAAAAAGDCRAARAHAAAVLPVVTAGFAEPNPALWKGALARRGELATGELRRPMTAASPAAVDRVLAAATQASAGS
jgi:4-hydroxy-tetrahydrodipicolinate synthase